MRLDGDSGRTFSNSYWREAFGLETLSSHGAESEQEQNKGIPGDGKGGHLR